jgi:hypothetical protein
VTEECIHGLEFDRCDLCSPKVVPKSDTAAPPAACSRSPRASSAHANAGTRPSTARSLQHRKPIVIGEQRIHHLTHIDNLAGILSDGLHADTSAAWGARPEVDISSADTREARRGIAIAGTEAIAGTGHGADPSAGATVADYVPFFLSPNAALWEGIRARTPDPRISARARKLPAAEFVLLVSTVKQVSEGLPDGSIVVTDADAADPRTRFAATGDDSERMLRRLLGEDESGSLQRAEFLVHGSVPFELIALVGVANDKGRSAVRAILGSSGHGPRLAVHPPWFALPSAE